MTTTRKTLLQRVRDHSDREAWEQFFELYAPILEGYARAHGLSRSDAEEVRDRCLEVVARRMPAFEYARERGRFKAWLLKIARGKVVDFLRRPGERAGEPGALVALEGTDPGPDAHWERHWRAEHLRHCLREVRRSEAEHTYRVFELLLVEELSVPEVCEKTGLNANQVYKAKARVLRRVREALERLGAGEDALGE